MKPSSISLIASVLDIGKQVDNREIVMTTSTEHRENQHVLKRVVRGKLPVRTREVM
jgi:hypothetical protein